MSSHHQTQPWVNGSASAGDEMLKLASGFLTATDLTVPDSDAAAVVVGSEVRRRGLAKDARGDCGAVGSLAKRLMTENAGIPFGKES